MAPKDDMEVSIRHIMVKTEEEAKAIIKELKKSGGADKFSDMVASKSIDASTKDKKGEIGYLPKKNLPADLADILFKVPKASMLPEPVKLGDRGFSVIRVEDKREMKPQTIEQLAPRLTQILMQRESAKIVMKLREDSKVELRDIKGNIIPNKPAE